MIMVNEIIDETLEGLQLSSDEIKELPIEEAKRIFNEAKSKFVDGDPRVWWLKLKTMPLKIDTDDLPGLSFLKDNWPSNESSCYFIPENESDTPRVFDASLMSVLTILENSSFFEYYLVGKYLNWLMIETDHNELLIVNESAAEGSLLKSG